MKRSIIKILLFISLLVSLDAQSALADAKKLPMGFRSILLGMTVNEVKEKLSADLYFNYRGDPDVSLLPEPEQILINSTGNSYINMGYFQFYRGKLFSIILEINRDKMDYYSIYTTLTGKYGEPGSLSPGEAVWQSLSVRLSLEKPLTVKYMDEKVFKKLKERGRTRENLNNISRKDFLDQF
ncbi:MAG: hypothetical protein GXP33_14135 [Spirochaetes bacterium]|nr:hypothetical protein [Spirochaetota bacterium]